MIAKCFILNPLYIYLSPCSIIFIPSTPKSNTRREKQSMHTPIIFTILQNSTSPFPVILVSIKSNHSTLIPDYTKQS